MTTEEVAEVKPKRVYNLEEKRITTKITTWLNKQEECWYFKKAGGTGRLPSGMFLKQRYGVPDLYICYHGRSVWAEIKKPGNYLQKEQKAEIAKMIAAGCEVFVIHSLDELKKVLEGE